MASACGRPSPRLEVDSDCFDELGADFEKVHPVKIGLVGSATTRLFSQRAAVDFARKVDCGEKKAINYGDHGGSRHLVILRDLCVLRG